MEKLYERATQLQGQLDDVVHGHTSNLVETLELAIKEQPFQITVDRKNTVTLLKGISRSVSKQSKNKSFWIHAL